MVEKMDDRIGRYLSGEMTGQERVAFEQEMAQDQRLKLRVEEDGRIWQLASAKDPGDWDVNTAWSRFSVKSQPTTDLKPRPFRRVSYWAVAASAILLVGIYGLFFRNGAPVVYTYQAGVTAPVALKDGTKIYLNKGAKVTVYPFTSTKREVDLNGEAFFEVAPDLSRVFLVTAGETQTEVVGTSFNIRQSDDQTQIFVKSGKVIFSGLMDGQKAAALTEGEAAIYKSGKIELIANPSPNINAWRTRDLRFIKMPLSSVIEDISVYFDQAIMIENEASKACIINIPLAKKPEINALLRAVAASINAEFVQEGNRYILRGGKDCS